MSLERVKELAGELNQVVREMKLNKVIIDMTKVVIDRLATEPYDGPVVGQWYRNAATTEENPYLIGPSRFPCVLMRYDGGAAWTERNADGHIEARILAYFGQQADREVCVKLGELVPCNPPVEPYAPKVGDWVIQDGHDIAREVREVSEGGRVVSYNYLTGQRVTTFANHMLRPATDEEIKRAKRITPRVGMLLKRKSEPKNVRVILGIDGCGTPYGAILPKWTETSILKEDLTIDHYEILDSIELKGM